MKRPSPPVASPSLSPNKQPFLNDNCSDQSSSTAPKVSSRKTCPDKSHNLSIARTIRGHVGEVFTCEWHPRLDMLASGSADATARITNLNYSAELNRQLVLLHRDDKAVTALNWNFQGTLLATGSFSGCTRVWSKDGALIATLHRHEGMVTSVKWNKQGDFILTVGADNKVILWNVLEGKVFQYSIHSAPSTDVDWQNDCVFVSCSDDRSIHICVVTRDEPVKSLSGHAAEIKAVRWNPKGNLIASCSEDMTVKIWSVNEKLNCKLQSDLRGHDSDIHTIEWSPTGPRTANPNRDVLLASASFDTTIRLWDVERGNCLRTLKGHSQGINSVAFSPDGQYLASGSYDKTVNIWSMQTGKCTHSFKGSGDMYQVCWNARGDKIGASSSDGSVYVLDFRKM